VGERPFFRTCDSGQPESLFRRQPTLEPRLSYEVLAIAAEQMGGAAAEDEDLVEAIGSGGAHPTLRVVRSV